MRLFGVRLLILALTLCVVLCTSCVSAASPQASSGGKGSKRWTTGFWMWNPAYEEQKRSLPAEPVDVLYILVGRIELEVDYRSQQKRWNVSGQLRGPLPPASEYWLVFRCESQGLPDVSLLPKLEAEIAEVLGAALQLHLNVVGIQLDIDSPTGSLPAYAKFLASVRKSFPNQKYKLSITALLDWFRSGTSIADVVAQTDEFVPQFYDTGGPTDRDAVIAERVDDVRWGRIFNQHRKPFRIGISSFGRARFVDRRGALEPRPASLYRDLGPLDLARNSGFRMQPPSQNRAGELVLTYRALRRTQIGYNDFEADQGVEFILATPESVRTAVGSARRIGGYASGVVFFRWPEGAWDSLVMQPNEVMDALERRSGNSRSAQVLQVDGGCAAVRCADVYLDGAEPLSAKGLAYRIRSASPLEYFIPEKGMPVRMVGDSEIELTLPPFSGRGRLFLGRSVSKETATWTVVEGVQK